MGYIWRLREACNKKKILSGIDKTRAELVRLAKARGLAHQETLHCSQRLDRLLNALHITDTSYEDFDSIWLDKLLHFKDNSIMYEKN